MHEHEVLLAVLKRLGADERAEEFAKKMLNTDVPTAVDLILDQNWPSSAQYAMITMILAGGAAHWMSRELGIGPYKESDARRIAVLEYLAHFDSLTELPNRRYFLERIEQNYELCCREGRIISVFFMDLDGFKPINDQIGHKAGDQALQAVARRLRSNFRKKEKLDLLARLEGDEFGIVLTTPIGKRVNDRYCDIFRIAIRLSECITADLFEVAVSDVAEEDKTYSVPLRLSIGVACLVPGVKPYRPTPAFLETMAARLLHNADRAMYQSKSGEIPFVGYTPGNWRWTPALLERQELAEHI